MARYLLIDVRFCARSRKHILSKRKQVHTSDIAHSQMQTDAICSKIDIHITVLAIEVYGNKLAIHSQEVELPDFTVSTWYPILISLRFLLIPA